jgi:RND family efflux transporter MFP subunit
MKTSAQKKTSMFAHRQFHVFDALSPLVKVAQRLGLISFLVFMSLLVACSEQPPPPVETIRTIRAMTVTEPASGRMRRFSGVVEAADTARISFEVSGTTQTVKVEVGEKVKKGQVLATLDDRTFKLDVTAAQAEVGRAQVELQDARSDLQRLRRIREKDPGAVSQRTIDQAEARYGSARNNLSFHTSRLNLAKRDLERTVLYAPFDGAIARRLVDPFEQVALGQQVFDLHMEEVMEAAISVPESEIEYVYLGLPAEIRFPAIPGEIHRGTVAEISRVAETANAFPVKVAIEAVNPRIRPGVTAEVNLLLAATQGDSAFLIPIEALAAGGSESQGYVFVFDAETSTVKKTAIETGTLRSNNIVVSKGLQAGDIIAAAGVSFLRDGQKVRVQER